MKKLSVQTNKRCLLTKYILDSFPLLSYNTLQKALRNKDIKLNGTRISKDTYVSLGDILEIYIKDNIIYKIPENIQYYYKDENIVVAFKYQGILSNNEENKVLDEPTFEDIVRKDLKNDNLRICHRLDRNTSGLVIFATSDRIFDEVQKAFKNFEIEKHYIAYVNNCKFTKSHDSLEAYLLKDKKSGFCRVYKNKVPLSEKIITEYSVLTTNLENDYAILDITLHTGKTHQIRAHLAYSNHEIIGDSKYGRNSINKKFRKDKQLLIAYKYKFNFTNDNLKYLNDKSIELEEEKLKLL